MSSEAESCILENKHEGPCEFRPVWVSASTLGYKIPNLPPPPYMDKPEEDAPRLTDEELADELVARLNKLIEDEDARFAVEELILRGRVVLPDKNLGDHPTIQLAADGPDGSLTLGFLGLLNGIVGRIKEGEFRNWGYIAAVGERDDEEEDYELIEFGRTDKKVSRES
jgi:hypothetical protein